MSGSIRVTAPSDLIAAIPHVMGFVPHEPVRVDIAQTRKSCSSGTTSVLHQRDRRSS